MPPARRMIRKLLCIAGTVIVGAHMVSCAKADLNAPARFMKRPGHRMGGLPFSAPFMLYKAADPESLGTHRYSTQLRFAFPDREKYRGIVYTCRAGFLDIAHIRKAVDWSKHFSVKIEHALTEGQEQIALRGEDPSLFHLAIRYPDYWPALTDERRKDLIRELSIQMGQRVSYLLSTWHEIATWFGYKTTIIIPEHYSAFTYDDIVAHLVGLNVAQAAMHDQDRGYDEAVTHALNEQLKQLGVVTVREAAEAIDRVKGLWWSLGGTKKRYLDVGVEGESLTPWLVRDLSFCASNDPESFSVPTITTVMDLDCSEIFDVRIEPRIMEAKRIRSVIESHPRHIRPKDHFPQLMERIHDQMAKAMGPDVNEPYTEAVVE